MKKQNLKQDQISTNSDPKKEIVYRTTSVLIPYARNSRTHSPQQAQQIASSIKEFGFTNPVLIDDDNGIIAGHGRVLAAQLLGMDEVPCIVLSGMTEAKKRAYVIADNKLALNAGWDDEMLRLEFEDLKAMDFNLDLTGFSQEEIDKLMPKKVEGLTDEDAVPDAPVDPVTVPGDVWILGDHRLMCGDSTSIDAVEKLMDGALADLCFTSPPYGQQRDYGAAKEVVQEWDALMNGVFSIIPGHDETQVIVNLGLIHRDGEWIPYWQQWLDAMASLEWRRFGLYVWDQGPGLPGDWAGRLAPSFELIFHFNKTKKKPQKWVEKKAENIREMSGSGLRRVDGSMSGVSSPEAGLQTHKIPDNVIRINRQATEKLGHPAAFPVAFPEFFINTYSSAKQTVYEPFCGSGTTIIAAEKAARTCYGMELDPKYCDLIIKRWQEFTGKQAVHAETGETFNGNGPTS